MFYLISSFPISLSLSHSLSVYICIERGGEKCSPMVRVQSLVKSYQRLFKKWYLIPPCLTLNIIRYVSRVKWSNPRKGVAPSPTPWCSSYWKGSLRVALDYSRQLLYIYIYIYIYSYFRSMVSIGNRSEFITSIRNRVLWALNPPEKPSVQTEKHNLLPLIASI